MIEFVPYMLIILWWHPDHPGTFDLERKHQLFPTEEACRVVGENYEAGVEMYSLEHGGAKVKYYCLSAPSGDEIEKTFLELSQPHMRESK
jgi:hypothetical protein